MKEKIKRKSLYEQWDELYLNSMQQSASIETPEGVESIGHMAEFGNRGLDRWFIYPNTASEAYQLFKTNAVGLPSRTFVWSKSTKVWDPDWQGKLLKYRINIDWYQEVTEAAAQESFPDAFPETPDVNRK